MPRRSNGRPLLSSGSSKNAKPKAQRRYGLNAHAVAEQQERTQIKIRQTRLGEIDEDGGRGRAPKRRKTEVDHNAVQEDSSGNDSEGNKWHVGLGSGDEDSDLDSDAALGESDEERFESFAFRGSASSKPTTRPKPETTKQRRLIGDIDLPESDSGDYGTADTVSEEEDKDDGDDLGEDAVDLVTALDLNEEEELRTQLPEKRKSKEPQELLQTGATLPPSDSDSIMGSEDDDLESSADDESASDLLLSEDGEQVDTKKLRQFVESLQESGATEQPQVERHAMVVPQHPSSFGIKPSKKITIAELLPTITDSSLKQSLKILQSNETAGPQRYKGGIPGKLEPPLAKRQQDRLDRAAAFDKSKESLDRWIDTVKQNRRAEHLSFPLVDQSTSSAPGTKELTSTSHQAPMTKLESAIQNIMQESGLTAANGEATEDQVQAFEELQQRRMPIEEVQARRAELRRARDLMFREEVRARRIKNIKSKSYRRVHRKERDRLAQEERAVLTAAGAINSDDERERNDRRRAEERMGARHKESRWAKGVKAVGRAAWDEDARAGVSDLARRDEELRKRIDGKRAAQSDQSGSDLTSSDEDNEDLLGSGDEENSYQRLESKLKALSADHEIPESTSKLASMPFMQRAEASRKAANNAEIEQMRRDVGGEELNQTGTTKAESTGRLKFGIMQKSESRPISKRPVLGKFEERLSEDESDIEEADREHEEALQFRTDPQPQSQHADAEKVVTKQKSISQNVGPKNPWTARSLKAQGRSARVSEKDEVLVNLNSSLTPASKSSQPKPSPLTSIVSAEMAAVSSSSDDEQETLTATDHAESRREELTRMAFAGDDVREDFDKEKQDTIEDEGDQVVDNTLPGWGSWTGTGISKREQKRAKGRFVTTIKGVQEDQRKDSKLDKVIINEKRIKKNAKYLAPELPHPFESRQQYERSLRLPMGPEWTTKTTYQDATKPRLLLKQGIIRPMARPMG